MNAPIVRPQAQSREFTTTGNSKLRTPTAIKSAFRLAINNAKSRSEARRIDRLRGKYFAGTLTGIDAMIAWMDLKLEAKEAPNKNVWAP